MQSLYDLFGNCHTYQMSVFVQQFSVEHAFSCSHGGFPSLRHNEIRDITAGLLTEVCSNVEIEPSLQLRRQGYLFCYCSLFLTL